MRGKDAGRALDAAEVEVTITALGGRGDAIARLESGEIVLVPGGVPGDRVRIRPHGRRAKVHRGQITAVLQPSTDRRDPACPVADTCGGCSWQHISLARQHAEKARNAERAIGFSPVQLGPKAEFGWRRRARFHLRLQGDQLQAGFMAERSGALTAISSCPVLSPPLDTLPGRVAAWLGPCLRRGEGLAHLGAEGVILRIQGTRRQPGPGRRGAGKGPADGPWRSARSKPAQVALAPLPAIDEAAAAALGVVGLELAIDDDVQRWGLREVTLAETAGPRAIRVDAGGFSQASAGANLAIRDAVRKALAKVGPVDGARELFAGSGNLTGLLLDAAPRVRTIERNAAATARARRCFAAESDRLTIKTGDASMPGGPPDGREVWLLDPGRSGAKETCVRIAQHRPAAVIYVSCAADTLGRDLAPLRDAGYAISAAWWVDTFPHTPHLELIVLLSLR